LKTILIIEDNFDIRSNLSELLEMEGYFVVALDDGTHAMAVSSRLQPDLIICNIKMPCDGWIVLEKLRSNAATATIPFVFLSAMCDRATLSRAANMGVELIVKPFKIPEFLERLQRLCH
jgi:DNA-binding response OmpR family regulator